MNLSRRAKLDREAEARGGVRKTPPAAVPPPPVDPPPPAEPPVLAVLPPVPDVPTPPVPTGPPPKVPRFVRPPAEKQAATATPLPTPSTKPAGKLMSKNVPAARPSGLAGQKGPESRRAPIENTKPRPFGRG